jgi:hypothetical protein
MNRKLAWRVVALCGIVVLAAFAQQGPYAPYREKLMDGVVDWDEGWIRTDVEVPLRAGIPPQQARVEAQRVAVMKAQAAALRIAMRVPVNSDQRLESFEALKVRVKGIVAGGQVVSENLEGKSYKLSLQVPMNGVQGIVSEVYKVTVPPPPPPEPEPQASKKPAPQPQQPPAEAPKPPEVAAKAPPPEKTVGRLDSVTIQAADAGVKPALQTRILDTLGNILYSVKTVKPVVAMQKALARYVTHSGSGDPTSWAPSGDMGPLPLALVAPWRLFAQTAPPPQGRQRGGGQTLEVKAVQASGALKADIVVTEETARKLKEAEASSGVLTDGKIVVVVRADVGGVESHRVIRLEPHDPLLSMK